MWSRDRVAFALGVFLVLLSWVLGGIGHAGESLHIANASATERSESHTDEHAVEAIRHPIMAPSRKVRMMIQKGQRLSHTKRQTSRTPTQWQDERDVDVELQRSAETEEAAEQKETEEAAKQEEAHHLSHEDGAQPPSSRSEPEKPPVSQHQPTKQGDLLTMAPLMLPFIYYWSTGNLASTVELYSRDTLFTAALSTLGWLLYGVLQLSFNDKVQVIGIDAVLVNAMTLGVLCFMKLFLEIYQGRASGKTYAVNFILHMVVMGILLVFPIYKPLPSTGKLKDVAGALAGVMQVISQLLPLIQLAKEWKKGPALGPQFRNKKKLTILSRSIDFIVTLYWMLYCLLTYKFDAFAISNIICSMLSLVSLVLHSAWAISPPPDHITIPEIEALPADEDSGRQRQVPKLRRD